MLAEVIGPGAQAVHSTPPAKAHRGDPGWPELFAHGAEVALDFSPPLRLVGHLVGRAVHDQNAEGSPDPRQLLAAENLAVIDTQTAHRAKEHVGFPGLVTKLGLKLLVSGRGEQLWCAQAALFEEAIQRSRSEGAGVGAPTER